MTYGTPIRRGIHPFHVGFCNQRYAYEDDLRYKISEDKVLVFFKDVMFKRRTPKVLRPGDTKDVRMAAALIPLETKAVRRVIDLRTCEFCRVILWKRRQTNCTLKLVIPVSICHLSGAFIRFRRCLAGSGPHEDYVWSF